MKLSKPFFVLYSITTDGHTQRFFEEKNSNRQIVQIMEDLGGMNDDRINTKIIATNVSFEVNHDEN